MSKRALASTLILLSTFVFFVNTADAQVGTARLEIRIVAGDEVALPGVEVVATETNTGFERRATTGELGGVLLTGLAPGTYRVEARFEDFETAVVPAEVLRTGHTVRLTLTLRPRLTGELEVTDRVPLIDPYRIDSSTNIVPEQMASLPVPDRSFEKLAFLTPGVQRERWDYMDMRGSPVVGSSSSAPSTAYFVDGASFSDPYVGRARVELSQDAIREMRVINNRFDAEIGGSAGGSISLVTKTGGNSVSGSVFGFYRSDELSARGALEMEDSNYSRTHLGFTIGGPIVRDRTHYFVAFEHLDEDDVVLVRPGGAFTGLTEDIVRPLQRTHLLASFDHRFSGSSNLTAKLLWERARQDNYLVGGVVDESHGYSRDNDNWSLRLGHTWVINEDMLNELRVQGGSRDLRIPMNSTDVGEWFSTGTTLQIGANLFGPGFQLDTDFFQIDDTFSLLGLKRHALRFGAGVLHTSTFNRQDRFEDGWMIYLTDSRMLPSYYYYGEGNSDANLKNNVISLFVQDDWRPNPKLTVSLGLRYDLETGATNPNFKHPLVGDRGIDTDNIQPRVGVSWNPDGEGRTVIRGGVGRYVGQFPLFASMFELTLNGVSGRAQLQRLNGVLVCGQMGIPPDLCPLPRLDPADPRNTGIPLAPNVELLADDLEMPESWQISAGISQRLGRTGLVFDFEAIWIDGTNETIFRNTNWAGNACRDDGDPSDCWLDPSYRWILKRTSEGRSEYRAVVASLNGTLKGGHLIAASVTLADKKNLGDRWGGFDTPSDSADIEAEWGPSATSERLSFVASAVFNLPWRLTLAPVISYGSGQPWNRQLGFDANGDAGIGGFADRAPGVGRNDQDGPSYSQVSLRLTKSIRLGGGDLDLLIECFNLFNTTNYDVNTVDNAQFLIDPSSGSMAPVPNPRYGEYLDTLPPREVQLGVRYRF
jgi:TonB dependent receptor-like, beta-barrel/Carboxypeptidase regulatory-like domain